MVYRIEDKIPFKKLVVFSWQMLMSVFVATVLIARICGVNINGALFGAGCATTVYTMITGFKSPMFISNSGAFVAPVLFALGLGGYTGVAIGGITTFIIYTMFGLIFRKVSVEKLYMIFPKSLIGAVTVVIGITLMGFIGTYVQINGETNTWGIIVALVTAISIALISHYSNGFIKMLPFLIGTIMGYLLCVVLTISGICPLVDFSSFSNMAILSSPQAAMSFWGKIPVSTIIPIVLIYAAYTVSAMMECLSDHWCLGNIIGVDLYKNPGLSRIFIGEGAANLVSSFFGGLGACSYGEGVACVGFSKAANCAITFTAAIMLMLLSYVEPVQVFICSIPNCVFGGAALILYGYIACSGIKTLQNVDLGDQKNLIIVSTVLSLGISGIAVGGTTFALSGTALALAFGVLLNIILKEE